jgi:hypothetical protein
LLIEIFVRKIVEAIRREKWQQVLKET